MNEGNEIFTGLLVIVLAVLAVIANFIPSKSRIAERVKYSAVIVISLSCMFTMGFLLINTLRPPSTGTTDQRVAFVKAYTEYYSAPEIRTEFFEMRPDTAENRVKYDILTSKEYASCMYDQMHDKYQDDLLAVALPRDDKAETERLKKKYPDMAMDIVGAAAKCTTAQFYQQ